VAAVAIDWLRAKPGIVAPIASARTVAQLDGILPTFTLDPSEIIKLDEASA
jgi:aryl-alcohol dehydrogenase-like predicted oxidoreductase